MEEYRKPKIEFYRQRSFSEKMNATFDFIRENWKILLKYTFYLIMPVCLIQTFAMNSFIDEYFSLVSSSAGRGFSGGMTGVLGNYGVLTLCSLMGSAIIAGMVYAMMQAYATRENGLRTITLNDFKEKLIVNAWKIIRISLFLIFICTILVSAVILLAVSVSTVSLFLTVPLFFVFLLLLIPFIMVVPVYIFERDIRFFDAIRKAWLLGTKTLGGMIAFMIVLSVISSVIQTVTMLPWYITILLGYLFSLTTESAMNQSVIYKFAVYILGLIQSYGAYVSSIIGAIGLAFHYFHAREKIEGVSIDSSISNFNDL
jgi:hypothetical protein